MNERKQPIKYNCTEKTFSIGFKPLSEEVNSRSSKNTNDRTKDKTVLITSQNNSLRITAFIVF
jgi:hypothetical protein